MKTVRVRLLNDGNYGSAEGVIFPIEVEGVEYLSQKTGELRGAYIKGSELRRCGFDFELLGLYDTLFFSFPGEFELIEGSKMSDKTVTHKGNIYEIGKPYMFRDSDEDEWVSGQLEEVELSSLSPLFTSNLFCAPYSQIRALEFSDLGTIKKAPAELVAGDVYMFNISSFGGLLGRYGEDGCIQCGYDRFDPADCTNIKKMVVEESK